MSNTASNVRIASGVIGLAVGGPLVAAAAWGLASVGGRYLQHARTKAFQVSPAVVELINLHNRALSLSPTEREWLVDSGYKLIISEGKHKWVLA